MTEKLFRAKVRATVSDLAALILAAMLFGTGRWFWITAGILCAANVVTDLLAMWAYRRVNPPVWKLWADSNPVKR